VVCTAGCTSAGWPAPLRKDLIEPPPTDWQFPDPRLVDGDFVAAGADLEPGTILAAYRHGLFPMPVARREVGWWSPDPRGIIPLGGAGGGLRVSRSLRKSCRRFEIRVDTAFDEVIDACGDPRRPHGWISDGIKAAYRRLHELGWVHSVEAWSLDDGTLAGGLYGVAVGGLFAGESMFHRETDASKVALVGLVELLNSDGDGHARLLDVQWCTDHLATLGGVEVPRDEYLRKLENALQLGPVSGFAVKVENPP
jgi:leucyl/phenylalanyl-tRNA---protein transferase